MCAASHSPWPGATNLSRLKIVPPMLVIHGKDYRVPCLAKGDQEIPIA